MISNISTNILTMFAQGDPLCVPGTPYAHNAGDCDTGPQISFWVQHQSVIITVSAAIVVAIALVVLLLVLKKGAKSKK